MTKCGSIIQIGRACVIVVLVLFTFPRCPFAQANDSLGRSEPSIKTQSKLSFQLSSGLGGTPVGGGNVLWNVKLMFGTPFINEGGMLWVGIDPTMVHTKYW